MKTLMLVVAVTCLMATCVIPAAGQGKNDDTMVRQSFDTQVALYIKTTQEDLKSNLRFPKATVSLLDSDIKKSDSLVTPYTGKIKYVIEYDDQSHPGERLTHPYGVTCSYFDGKWGLDPHGHRMRKNVIDLSPKETEILYPNI